MACGPDRSAAQKHATSKIIKQGQGYGKVICNHGMVVGVREEKASLFHGGSE
jgi:hypothetical protein